MGKHEAVHQNVTNRIIHWICIPCQIFAACLFFSNFEFSSVPLHFGPLSIYFNLSLIIIASMCVLYFAMDTMGGVLTAILWTPLLCAANYIHQASLLGDYEIFFALMFFASTFSVQVGVGHNVFEEGRDDTEQNIGEFVQTWNPIFITCIPFYHHMEILFNGGLRPDVYKAVLAYQHAD